LSATSGITVVSDGVHAGISSFVGNTTNPSIPSNTWGFLGPPSASFTSWFIQPSGTGPSATCIAQLGTVASNISALSCPTLTSLLASPPAIGASAAAAGTFTTIAAPIRTGTSEALTDTAANTDLSTANTTPTVTGASTTVALATTTPTNVGNAWTYTLAATETGAGTNGWVGAVVTMSGWTGCTGNNASSLPVTASTTTTVTITNASGSGTSCGGTPVIISTAVSSSPLVKIAGTVNTGGAGTLNSAPDYWTLQDVIGSVVPNPTSTLSFAHIGSSGTSSANFPSVSTGTAPSCTVGTGGAWCAGEGTAPTAASSVDQIYADSTAHRFNVLNNGGSVTTLAQFTDNLSVFATGGAIGPASIALQGSSPAITTPGTTPYVNMNTLVLGALNGCKITSTGVAMTVSGTAYTICSWTLPNTAATWTWQCSGTYTTTTSSDTFALGYTASQAPSAAVGNGIIWSAASTQTYGSVSSTTSTANQTIMTGVSVSSVTSIPWSSSGYVTASATSGTFVLTGMLTGSSPSGHVNAGSTCTLY
jgi:hypothetical protein